MDNNTTQIINWFPGHMARTRRLMEEQARKCDYFIEICDARLPFSSRNPELGRIFQSKPGMLILNKCDLADKTLTRLWMDFYQRNGLSVHAMNLKICKDRELTVLIQKQTFELTQRFRDKGIRKSLKIMVAGVPNVGKSTFINHLRGAKSVQTGDRPGVTKSNQWVRISPYLEILDTPGLLWPRLDDQTAARRLCYLGIVKDDILDLTDLTVSLLNELLLLHPIKVMDRYHLTQKKYSDPTELLNDVCRGRGWLLKGNQFDYDRCCRIVLDEFREGKLGPVTFETPDSQLSPVKGVF